MCGWAGLWEWNSHNSSELGARVKKMSGTLVHRGPDDDGVWSDPETGVALGFRRLAIIDLSPEGHQPMQSASGRFVIVFNGEVYNFAALRQELEPLGHRFRGHSDTEVILAAIEEWGLEAAVRRFIGMFAFAMWDRMTRRLFLVRDRLGVKPLYYGWAGETFLFGSELKALRAYSGFRAEVDRGSLSLLMRHNYVPAPYSIYKNIFKLTPGCILTVTSPHDDQTPIAYWSAKETAEQGIAHPLECSPNEAVEQLDTLLRDAIGLRMVADVPLGAFLSGGIDSSIVVALMQAQTEQAVKTFTIGFHETGYDEALYAREVARHLGTDHTELYVTPTEAQTAIPRMSEIYDEPFSDSSQIPTFLVSELTRRSVTVSLSGDGGDELFGGYSRYTTNDFMWRALKRLPVGARRGLARGITSISASTLDKGFGWLASYMERFGRRGSVGDKLHKVSELLALSNAQVLYLQSISHWKMPVDIVTDGYEPPTALTDPQRQAAIPDFIHRMMYLDTISYLPDDIMAKVDRASMAVSLEAREPLLDHRVVEFAWRVPLALKIREGKSKWILRQVLQKYIPSEMIDRPKMGFGVPVGLWLRGPLRDWAEALLDEQRLENEGFFNPKPIRLKWSQHLSDEYNWQGYLWDVLMFQAWLERWG